MANGGLIQIVALGPQNVYLTTDPTITFFKAVYRRHTNFAMESIEQTFSGAVDFGRTVSAVITRAGDLMHRTYVQVQLPAISNGGAGTVSWVRNIGNVIIDKVAISVGSSTVDTLYGVYMHIWSELTETKSHEAGYKEMIGDTVDLTTLATSVAAATLTVPLPFWFCRHIGSSLPLIALQFNEVKMEVTFRPFSQCYRIDAGGLATPPTPVLTNASLWVDYIYLDNTERTNFAASTHEYLIDQVQFHGVESISQTSVRQRISFNHPVKELIWAVQLDSNVSSAAVGLDNANRWTDFTNGVTPYTGKNHLVDAGLQLNGHQRFTTRHAGYFNTVQPRQHHTKTPSTGIYSYSFANKPEEFQPTGSLNMSKIDNATLALTLASSAVAKLYIFATNLNIFRVRSGMGGVAYAS
jgi:hypothetical protein